MTAFELGTAHTCSNALDDQVAFEFGDCAEDDDNRTAQRAARVDILAERNELDAKVIRSSSTSRKCFTERATRSNALGQSTHADAILKRPHHSLASLQCAPVVASSRLRSTVLVATAGLAIRAIPLR